MTFRYPALRLLACFLLFAISAAPRASTAGRSNLTTIPQCTQVSLTAAYLAQVTAAEGPGFLLTIVNDTDHLIRLAKPLPTSAHWYAQRGTGPWLWRASSGSGGALADALREHGPLLVYRLPSTSQATSQAAAPARPIEYLTVGAHQRVELAESMRDSPILRFRPGCERCSNPQDERYRAVLAYGYLPAPGSPGPDLLPCGLRSGPIVMPPLE